MSKSSFVVWRFESILGPGDKPDQQRCLSRVCSLQVSDLTGFMSWAILPLVWLVTEGLDTVLGDLIAWQKNPAAWNYSPFKCTWDLAEPYTGSLHRNLTNSYKKRPDKCGSPRQGVLHQKGRQACSVFLNPGGKKQPPPFPEDEKLVSYSWKSNKQLWWDKTDFRSRLPLCDMLFLQD